MKLNMSSPDRVIRAIIAVVLLALSFTGVITGALQIIAIILSVVFLLTAFVGFCPLYRLFHISTKSV